VCVTVCVCVCVCVCVRDDIRSAGHRSRLTGQVGQQI